jgi:hypothetical protein
MVLPDPQEMQEPWDPLDQRVTSERLENQDNPDPVESEDLRETRGQRENRAKMDPMDQKEKVVALAQSVQLVFLELLAPLDREDPRDQREKMAQLVPKDTREMPDAMGRMETPVSLE